MKNLFDKIDEWIAKEQAMINSLNSIHITMLSFGDLARVKAALNMIRDLEELKELIEGEFAKENALLYHESYTKIANNYSGSNHWDVPNYTLQSFRKMALYCGILSRMDDLPEKAIIKEKKAVAATH